MAIKYLEKKITDATLVESVDLVTTEEVDEYVLDKIKYDKALEKIAPLKKSVEGKEKALIAAVDEVIGEGTEYTLRGEKWDVELGKKGAKTEITDIELAQDILEGVQPGLFMKLATISISDLKDYMTPEQIEQVTATKLVNKRRTKAVKHK